MKHKHLTLLGYILILIFLSWVISFPLRQAQSSLQPTNLSEESVNTLPCVWMDGRAIVTEPPIPTSADEPEPGFLYRFCYPKRGGMTFLYPDIVDFLFPGRLLPDGFLENTLATYQQGLLSPSESRGCYPTGQMTNEEMLYFQTQEIDSKNPYGLYFAVNPYRNSSQLVFSIPRKQTSPLVQYIGYLSDTSEFCFLSENRLFLLDRATKTISRETILPSSLLYCTTDLHSLVLFVDQNRTLHAYSVRKHALLWQNSILLKITKKDHALSNQNIIIKGISSDDRWLILCDQEYRFSILSTSDGDEIVSFTIPTDNTELIPVFREWFGSIWIQYIEKEGDTQNIRLIQVSLNRDHQVQVNRYQLADPYTDPIRQTRLHEATPTHYSFIPALHQLFILYRDQHHQEIQTVYQMP